MLLEIPAETHKTFSRQWLESNRNIKKGNKIRRNEEQAELLELKKQWYEGCSA